MFLPAGSERIGGLDMLDMAALALSPVVPFVVIEEPA